MKIITSYIYIIFLLLVLSTCVKPYNPDIEKYKRVIVIDGTLLDDGTPPIVYVSFSSNVRNSDAEKISGAVVYIQTSDGQKYNLSEKSKGLYTYTQTMFPVNVDRSYQLIVEYDSHLYKSTMEKLLLASPISDISYKVKSDSLGVDILLSTKEIDSTTKYYQWKLTETWKFRTPIYSSKRSVNKEICYATTRDELMLGTTELYSHNNFNKFPILYIPVSSPKLFFRYSIMIEQLSISRSTYMYLNHIKRINESNNILFDPIPANMNGNISSENAPVIGNFQVSSISFKRIYIDRSDLPNSLKISSGMEECKLEVVSLSAENDERRESFSRKMEIMDTIKDVSGTYVRFVTKTPCFDCTATGFPNTPPSWWEEKK